MSARSDKDFSKQIILILCLIANKMNKIKKTLDTIDKRMKNDSKNIFHSSEFTSMPFTSINRQENVCTYPIPQFTREEFDFK